MELNSFIVFIGVVIQLIHSWIDQNVIRREAVYGLVLSLIFIPLRFTYQSITIKILNDIDMDVLAYVYGFLPNIFTNTSINGIYPPHFDQFSSSPRTRFGSSNQPDNMS